MKTGDVRLGQGYACKVGRNEVKVKVVAAREDGGWTVTTASGRNLTIRDAARLSVISPAGAEERAQGATGATAAVGARKTATATRRRDTLARHSLGDGGAQQGANETKKKRPSLLSEAADVLQRASQPMNAKEMVEAVLARGQWSTKGKTPASTLYASILREIQKKGDQARFVKTERGKFSARA